MTINKRKKYIDLSNLKCPLPLLRTKLLISDLSSGDEIEVTATDPTSWSDFISYSRVSGNKLLNAKKKENKFIYTLQKR